MSREDKISVGDLVKHHPEGGTAVQRILNKLTTDEITTDFSLGLVIERRGKMCRVFSSQLSGVMWYEPSELVKLAGDRNED